MTPVLAPISSVLIANRGEIALRIMRSARAQGLRVIAVFTEADREAPHVRFADQGVLIGAGPVAESYLNIEKILDAAQRTDADAIHPGYGFLSERADFASACADAGRIFIGPSPEAISLMGDKAAARRRMIQENVPCIPGYEGEDQSDDAFVRTADTIGFPVMIKAAAGGGGRGMRLVTKRGDLIRALARARSEAQNAFGSDVLILEKALIAPRHVEIQIIADRAGQTIHLGERDCSLQRRHQKVVEESPCPVMTPALRNRMGQAAIDTARSIGYEGVGTVEFLLDADGAYYFLEMNTRLQVEHPVTELITGLDLVALQFRIAQGQPLGLAQQDIAFSGHAIEARLYAEDPANGFLPSTGKIALWQPAKGPDLRIDAGIDSDAQISPHYDPLLAKIIAFGDTRETARLRLIDGLKNTTVFGPANNRDFLIAALATESFAKGATTTAFMAEEFPEGAGADTPVDFSVVAVAAGLLWRELQNRSFAKTAFLSPELLDWDSSGGRNSRLCLANRNSQYQLTLRQCGSDQLVVHAASQTATVDLAGAHPRVDGVRLNLLAHLLSDDQIYLNVGAYSYRFRQIKASGGLEESSSGGRITAPMHGNLIGIDVTPGQRVRAGNRVAVLEAMKMQHELLAPVSGEIIGIQVAVRTQVKAGDLLIEIRADDDQKTP